MVVALAERELVEVDVLELDLELDDCQSYQLPDLGWSSLALPHAKLLDIVVLPSAPVFPL